MNYPSIERQHQILLALKVSWRRCPWSHCWYDHPRHQSDVSNERHRCHCYYYHREQHALRNSLIELVVALLVTATSATADAFQRLDWTLCHWVDPLLSCQQKTINIDKAISIMSSRAHRTNKRHIFATIALACALISSTCLHLITSNGRCNWYRIVLHSILNL